MSQSNIFRCSSPQLKVFIFSRSGTPIYCTENVSESEAVGDCALYTTLFAALANTKSHNPEMIDFGDSKILFKRFPQINAVCIASQGCNNALVSSMTCVLEHVVLSILMVMGRSVLDTLAAYPCYDARSKLEQYETTLGIAASKYAFYVPSVMKSIASIALPDVKRQKLSELLHFFVKGGKFVTTSRQVVPHQNLDLSYENNIKEVENNSYNIQNKTNTNKPIKTRAKSSIKREVKESEIDIFQDKTFGLFNVSQNSEQATADKQSCNEILNDEEIYQILNYPGIVSDTTEYILSTGETRLSDDDISTGEIRLSDNILQNRNKYSPNFMSKKVSENMNTYKSDDTSSSDLTSMSLSQVQREYIKPTLLQCQVITTEIKKTKLEFEKLSECLGALIITGIGELLVASMNSTAQVKWSWSHYEINSLIDVVLSHTIRDFAVLPLALPSCYSLKGFMMVFIQRLTDKLPSDFIPAKSTNSTFLSSEELKKYSLFSQEEIFLVSIMLPKQDGLDKWVDSGKKAKEYIDVMFPEHDIYPEYSNNLSLFGKYVGSFKKNTVDNQSQFNTISKSQTMRDSTDSKKQDTWSSWLEQIILTTSVDLPGFDMLLDNKDDNNLITSEQAYHNIFRENIKETDPSFIKDLYSFKESAISVGLHSLSEYKINKNYGSHMLRNSFSSISESLGVSNIFPTISNLAVDLNNNNKTVSKRKSNIDTSKGFIDAIKSGSLLSISGIGSLLTNDIIDKENKHKKKGTRASLQITDKQNDDLKLLRAKNNRNSIAVDTPFSQFSDSFPQSIYNIKTEVESNLETFDFNNEPIGIPRLSIIELEQIKQELCLPDIQNKLIYEKFEHISQNPIIDSLDETIVSLTCKDSIDEQKNLKGILSQESSVEYIYMDEIEKNNKNPIYDKYSNNLLTASKFLSDSLKTENSMFNQKFINTDSLTSHDLYSEPSLYDLSIAHKTLNDKENLTKLQNILSKNSLKDNIQLDKPTINIQQKEQIPKQNLKFNISPSARDAYIGIAVRESCDLSNRERIAISNPNSPCIHNSTPCFEICRNKLDDKNKKLLAKPKIMSKTLSPKDRKITNLHSFESIDSKELHTYDPNIYKFKYDTANEDSPTYLLDKMCAELIDTNKLNDNEKIIFITKDELIDKEIDNTSNLKYIDNSNKNSTSNINYRIIEDENMKTDNFANNGYIIEFLRNDKYDKNSNRNNEGIINYNNENSLEEKNDINKSRYRLSVSSPKRPLSINLNRCDSLQNDIDSNLHEKEQKSYHLVDLYGTDLNQQDSCNDSNIINEVLDVPIYSNLESPVKYEFDHTCYLPNLADCIVDINNNWSNCSHPATKITTNEKLNTPLNPSRLKRSMNKYSESLDSCGSDSKFMTPQPLSFLNTESQLLEKEISVINEKKQKSFSSKKSSLSRKKNSVREKFSHKQQSNDYSKENNTRQSLGTFDNDVDIEQSRNSTTHKPKDLLLYFKKTGLVGIHYRQSQTFTTVFGEADLPTNILDILRLLTIFDEEESSCAWTHSDDKSVVIIQQKLFIVIAIVLPGQTQSWQKTFTKKLVQWVGASLSTLCPLVKWI